MRYGLLEILRLYAAEHLKQSQETAAALTHHANYYSQLLATQHRSLQGTGQVAALRMIQAELENIRAMARCFLQAPTVTPPALRQLAAGFEGLFVFKT